MSAPRWQEPNLARAPFVNERPVRRLAGALWFLFAVCAGAAIWLSLLIRQESGDRLAELLQLDAETVSARERAVALEKDLRSSDLPAQNERTEFLNRRLAERAFSWSGILETLAQTMPRGVRLVRLSPEGFASERARVSASVRNAATTRVALRITGEAEETEALLEFVDRLFQHPAFDQPNLSRESENKDSKIQFELTVAYLPQVGGQASANAGPAVHRPDAAAAFPGGATPASAGGPRAGGDAPTESAARPAAEKSGGSAVTRSERPPARADSRGADRAAAAPGAMSGDEERAVPAATGRGIAGPTPSTRQGRDSGVPSRSVPGNAGGGSRPGFTTPSAGVPVVGGGTKSPANVAPVPLKPYASSSGGGR